MLSLQINNKNIEIKFRTFGGGEPHIYVDNIEHNVQDNCIIKVSLNFENSSDIINLMLLNNILENNLINIKCTKVLECLYLPFSRQDRITGLSEPFSLKVICDIINGMNFDIVFTLDNHSDVSNALLKNNINLDNISNVLEVLDITDYNTICSPDAGSLKKTLNILKELPEEYSMIRADKIRNLRTGEITRTEVYGDCSGKNILIVDDICDGGRTFLELAKVLYDRGATKVGLFVSHGIFSRGKHPLIDAGIIDVFCINNLGKE